jgi:stearoyl-CoA desaturase (delta-9 desaturase)
MTDVAIATVRTETTRASRLVTLAAVVVPPLGLLSAAGLLWGVALSWVDVVLFAVFYTACGLGVTVGYHRLFTHRSFETTPWLRATFAVLGAMSTQGPVTQWVTDHRRHHALSDREGDPHSPHAGHGEGRVARIKGFTHSHVTWLFHTKGMERGEHYGRDIYADSVLRAVDRLYFVWVVMTFALPFALGYALGGLSVSAGVQALVWAGLIRVFAYQHATFSVNSVCHMFGSRAYRSRDESRNNAVVAALTFGEGWHNNHHAFPSSARHGLGRRQLDAAWLTIRGLEHVGLAWDVKVPDAERLRRRRLTAS